MALSLDFAQGGDGVVVLTDADALPRLHQLQLTRQAQTLLPLALSLAAKTLLQLFVGLRCHLLKVGPVELPRPLGVVLHAPYGQFGEGYPHIVTVSEELVYLPLLFLGAALFCALVVLQRPRGLLGACLFAAGCCFFPAALPDLEGGGAGGGLQVGHGSWVGEELRGEFAVVDADLVEELSVGGCEG